MAMVQNQWHHFGIGAPPVLVYFSGDWDVTIAFFRLRLSGSGPAPARLRPISGSGLAPARLRPGSGPSPAPARLRPGSGPSPAPSPAPAPAPARLRLGAGPALAWRACVTKIDTVASETLQSQARKIECHQQA